MPHSVAPGGDPLGKGSAQVMDGAISFDFNYQVNCTTQYLAFNLTRSADGRYQNGTQTYPGQHRPGLLNQGSIGVFVLVC
jgi:hypothetical protein